MAHVGGLCLFKDCHERVLVIRNLPVKVNMTYSVDFIYNIEGLNLYM